MDKELAIKLINSYYNKEISPQDLIYEYCISNGKLSYESIDFVQTVNFIPGLVNQLTNYILDKYTSEYEICIITDKNNNFIKAY